MKTKKYLEYLKQYRLKNKQKRKKYLLLNKKKLKKQSKQYYLNNKEKIIEYKKKYYLHNIEILKEKSKKRYLKNKEKRNKHSKKYYLKNKEKIKKYQKLYRQKNREKLNQYRYNKIKTDPIFKLILNQRNRIFQALRKMKKSKSTLKLLNCSAEELWNHLEKQFKPRMTRKNYGKWHVDHIRPCASFDLSDPKQQAICFHYTNLQPLWASENISKGAKYEME